MWIFSALRKLFYCCRSNTDRTEGVHLTEAANRPRPVHLDREPHLENNPLRGPGSSDSVSSTADPQVDPSVATNLDSPNQRSTLSNFTQIQDAEPGQPENPSSPVCQDFDEVKVLVEQLKTTLIQSVDLLCPNECAEHDRIRRILWDQVNSIIDCTDGKFCAVKEASAVVEGLEEEISVPTKQTLAARSGLVDLIRLALQIRGEKEACGAYYPLVWQDSTDEEHMEELTLWKDDLPILSKIDLRTKASGALHE